MYESRVDTLPRADEVLGFFCRNLEHVALTKVRAAFKVAWDETAPISSPLDFKVAVEFGRVLPDPVLKAIETELQDHGWTNFVFDAVEVDGVKQSTLVVKLDHSQASEYA